MVDTRSVMTVLRSKQQFWADSGNRCFQRCVISRFLILKSIEAPVMTPGGISFAFTSNLGQLLECVPTAATCTQEKWSLLEPVHKLPVPGTQVLPYMQANMQAAWFVYKKFRQLLHFMHSKQTTRSPTARTSAVTLQKVLELVYQML